MNLKMQRKMKSIKDTIIEKMKKLEAKSDFIKLGEFNFGFSSNNMPSYESTVAFRYLVSNGWEKFSVSEFGMENLPFEYKNAHGNTHFMYKNRRKEKIKNFLEFIKEEK